MKKIFYIIFGIIILFGFNMNVSALECSYATDIGVNMYNTIIMKNGKCQLRVAVYGDMGAVEEQYRDCSSELSDWIKNNDRCPDNFNFDPNANYDLETNDNEESYNQQENHKQQNNETIKDNPGTAVYTCKGLIGPNTLILLNKGLNLIMIAGPMLAVVLGSYDLLVAMAKGEEDDKKKGMKKFKNRLIAAGLLLLLPAIVKLLLNFFEKGDSSCLEALENLFIWKF